MRRYVVRRSYESHVGRFVPGQVLELDDELAAWLGRDLPGVIEELVPAPPAPVVETHMLETPEPGVETHVVQQPRRQRRKAGH